MAKLSVDTFAFLCYFTYAMEKYIITTDMTADVPHQMLETEKDFYVLDMSYVLDGELYDGKTNPYLSVKDFYDKLAEGKKVSMVKRFFMQLANPMIIVLIIAALVSLLTTLVPVMSGKGHFDATELAEFFIIIAVVLLNAILGVVQEGRAERQLRL